MAIMQVASIEERESVIQVDYASQTVNVYTNVAVVMNRMDKLGFKPIHESVVEGQIFGRDYELPFKDMGKVTKVGIFNCGRAE